MFDDRLELACIDGVDALSRNVKSSAQASKRVAIAVNDARLARAAHKNAKDAGIKLVKDALTAAIRQERKFAEDLRLAEQAAAKKISRAMRSAWNHIKEARTARSRAIVEAKRTAQRDSNDMQKTARAMKVASLLGRQQLSKARWLFRKQKCEAACINGGKIAGIIRAAKIAGARSDKILAEAHAVLVAERAKRISAVHLEERRGREKFKVSYHFFFCAPRGNNYNK